MQPTSALSASLFAPWRFPSSQKGHEDRLWSGLEVREGALGRHFLVELYDCASLPQDVDTLQRHMEHAATLIGATIVASRFHAFAPFGLSGVVVIAESHLAIHTWPEHGCACVDLFTCSAVMAPEPGLDYLRRTFAAGRVESCAVPRGAHAVRGPSADDTPGVQP